MSRAGSLLQMRFNGQVSLFIRLVEAGSVEVEIDRELSSRMDQFALVKDEGVRNSLTDERSSGCVAVECFGGVIAPEVTQETS